MKKAFIFYLVILIGVFAVLSTMGQKGEYVVEKRVSNIQLEFAAIAREPEAIPDRKYDEVAEKIQAIIDQYPDSKFAPGLYVSIGRLYALRKDYDRAREQFDLALKKYPDNKELCAETLFLSGKTYEAEYKWGKAYDIYKSIMDRYPETNKGMDIPLYVAHYYKDKKETQSAILAYDLAINYYKRIASEQAGTRLGFNALRYLSNCYLEQADWNETIQTLGKILEDYATSGYLKPKSAELMVKTINVVSTYQLKNSDIAIGVYQGILDRNPDHPLRAYLEKVIEAFKMLEEKGVQVTPQE